MSAEYKAITDYINRNPIAVLSTNNPDGTPHGSVVYVCALQGQRIGMITKNKTQKYRNIVATPAVCLTFMNVQDNSTLQVSGMASVANDAHLIDTVMNAITQVQAAQSEWLPPIAKLRAGQYEVIIVRFSYARLGQYKGQDIGSDTIFEESNVRGN